MAGLAVLAAIGISCLLVKLALDARTAIRKLGGCPGRLHWTVVSPMNAFVILIGRYFPPRGWFLHYDARFVPYAHEGITILKGLWLWGMTPVFTVADVDGLKQVTSDRSAFSKDVKAYEHVDIYGKSIVSTDGAEWRRHLQVAGPAFSDANNAMVWRETRRLVQEWFADELDPVLPFGHSIEDVPKSVEVDGLEAMRQLTLHTIAAAGFGMRTEWSAFSEKHLSKITMDAVRTKKHAYLLPFHNAMEYTLSTLFYRAGTPAFLYDLPVSIPWLSDQLAISSSAFSSLKVHMARLVESIRKGQAVMEKPNSLEEEEQASDLLRRLVEANDVGQHGTEKGTLTEGELYSNIFMFLLAGHETTAHTMTFAFTCLAMYPDIQRKLREEAFWVWPTDDAIASSTYKTDFEKFAYTMAFFREVLRCFPMEPRLVKICEQDTTLTARTFTPASPIDIPSATFDGSINHVSFKRDEKSEQKTTVPVPKGSLVVMDIWGLHLNPMVWGDDAHEFKPERFIDTDTYKWPRDGFMTFSAGPRGCIGRQFAYVEAVVALALIVRNFELFPIVPDTRHKSREELRRVLLGYVPALSIRPTMTKVALRRYTRQATDCEDV